MTTRVVNVKVQNIRPKYKNLKDWSNDSNNVYIGRRGVVFVDGYRFPTNDSRYANPFKIDKDGSRDEVLNKYKKYIKSWITDEDYQFLCGKNLGCWCKPLKCHGDILVDMIKQWQEENN